MTDKPKIEMNRLDSEFQRGFLKQQAQLFIDEERTRRSKLSKTDMIYEIMAAEADTISVNFTVVDVNTISLALAKLPQEERTMFEQLVVSKLVAAVTAQKLK